MFAKASRLETFVSTIFLKQKIRLSFGKREDKLSRIGKKRTLRVKADLKRT